MELRNDQNHKTLKPQVLIQCVPENIHTLPMEQNSNLASYL